MAIRKSIFALAFFITLFLFVTILLLGNQLGDKRQEFIQSEMQRTYNSLNEMQTFWLMSDTYGNEMACLAFSSKLQDLDKSVWNLGIKLDQYRSASEEFRKSQFYQEQKRTFNENEVMYLLLLRKMKEQCDYQQVIVLFFYQNSAECGKCDDQSFVLTDVNRQFDQDISIFSFDLDLNITSVNLLRQYYNITEYPCTVIDDTVLCGIRSKDEVVAQVCEELPGQASCVQDAESAI